MSILARDGFVGDFCPEFDASKYRLGKLCKRGHDYSGDGRSLRHANGNACVQCGRDRVKQWKKDNPDKVKKNSALYNTRHREHRTEVARIYRQQNREMCRAYHKSLYWKNPEKGREKARYHRKTLKGKARRVRYRHERREMLKANRVPYTTEQMMQRLEDFGRCCAYCGDKLKLQGTGNDVFHWDHFQPLTKGGIDCITNLLPACSRCNINKSNHDPIEWYINFEFFSEARWMKIQSTLSISEACSARRQYQQLTLFGE